MGKKNYDQNISKCIKELSNKIYLFGKYPQQLLSSFWLLCELDKISPDDNERWRFIPGYDGYLISSNGRVYSNKHKKILQGSNVSGCPIVTLRHDGSSINLYIHRLVAEVFIPNPNNYFWIKYIDGNKRNVHFSNLQWVQKSEIMNQDSYINQPFIARKKYSDDILSEIFALKSKGHSVGRIAKISGVPEGTLQGMFYGKSYQYLRDRFGFHGVMNSDNSDQSLPADIKNKI